MVIAAIQWEAVVAVASGIGVVISLGVAWMARSTATAAKAQAEAARVQAAAAEAQAEAAAKEVEIAERAHERATEPRLRIGRYPDGSAKVFDPTPILVIGDGPIERSEWLKIEIENLRDAAADIDEVRVNDYPADVDDTRSENDNPASASFGAAYFSTNREPHEILVLYHARDTGLPGVLEATIKRLDGDLVVVREKDEATDHPVK